MPWKKFLYKISKDLLISLIITYVFVLVPELVLPGVVSSHFSPKYLLVLILILAWLFAYLGKDFPAPEQKNRFRAISRTLLNALLVVITVMLILSIYKMKLWAIVIVALFSVFLLIVSQKMIVEED